MERGTVPASTSDVNDATGVVASADAGSTSSKLVKKTMNHTGMFFMLLHPTVAVFVSSTTGSSAYQHQYFFIYSNFSRYSFIVIP
jgi:hypothetical protein